MLAMRCCWDRGGLERYRVIRGQSVFIGVLFLEIHESIRHSFMTTWSFAHGIMSAVLIRRS